MAFARAVRSQTPISTERIAVPKQTSDDVLEDSQEVASTERENSLPTIEQPIARRSLEPMKWDGSEREEITQRVANFKAHQQRFIREREDYARSTLGRMQASQDAGAEELRRLVAYFREGR
jgi:hypothetical protein